MAAEYKIITDHYVVQRERTKRFANLKWSPDEQLLKDRPKQVRDFFKHRQVPFRVLCEAKFKHSLFGLFLRRHNKAQAQDYFMNDNKLAMLDYDLKTYSENELKRLECDNNFAPDLRKLLERAVDEKEVIDYDFLYDNVCALRFCDTPLTFIDGELLKFRHLKVLILCGNWLTDIPGALLPKSLEYIELFANQIECVHNFACKVPRRLMHVGLRRNWLTNDSKLHLLGNATKFHFLQSLDLSENDIYDLRDVLQPLQELKQLMCLQLQGNPCSVINCYKDEVLRYVPSLDQLDLTEILDVDRDVVERRDRPIDAAITFTCHRIMGLPKPIVEKGIDPWFYFSVSMPLLEDIIEAKGDEGIEVEESPSEPSNQLKDEATKVTKATKDENVAGKSTNATGSPYNGRDEYAEECRRRVVDTTFKSERFAWDKIMQLPEEALLIKSAERNFADIRDTLRSSVCVRLIYLEVRPPERPKKATKPSKSDANKNTSKSSKRSATTVKTTSQMSSRSFEEPKETIVRKITLAKFACDLHSINWSDKTIDYIWAEQKQFDGRAQEVEGSLRCLDYSEKGKQKKTAKTSSMASSKTENSSPQLVKQQVPNVFTVHLGFGLQRSYYQS